MIAAILVGRIIFAAMFLSSRWWNRKLISIRYDGAKITVRVVSRRDDDALMNSFRVHARIKTRCTDERRRDESAEDV